MDKEAYKELLKKNAPKEKKVLNALIAFGLGGLLGVFSEAMCNLYMVLFGISKTMGYTCACITSIFLGCALTAFGVYDKLVTKAKMGLIIPTTGFAHSITSAAMEYRKEGLIKGLGANFFKLAGSVLLYGIVSAFLLCLLGVVIYG